MEVLCTCYGFTHLIFSLTDHLLKAYTSNFSLTDQVQRKPGQSKSDRSLGNADEQFRRLKTTDKTLQQPMVGYIFLCLNLKQIRFIFASVHFYFCFLAFYFLFTLAAEDGILT